MKSTDLFQLEKSAFLAEVEVTYKNRIKMCDRVKVTCSRDIADVLKEVWSDKLEYVEEFLMLCLNRANHVLGWVKISTGSVAATVADPKIIFQIALKTNAAAIVVAHNHPSGQLKPSAADFALTKKLVEAGKFLDLPILDHIILTGESYYSFADEGNI